MLFVSAPHAIILNSIRPRVDSLAVDLILAELSFIDAAIGTDKLPITALSSIFEFAFVRRFVLECLLTFAVCLLVQPFPLVESPIRVLTNAKAVHLILHPHAFVQGSVTEEISAFTISFAALPHTEVVRFISRQIQPDSFKFLISYSAHIDVSILKR